MATDLNQLFNQLIPMLLYASQRRRQDDLSERRFQSQERQNVQDRTESNRRYSVEQKQLKENIAYQKTQDTERNKNASLGLQDEHDYEQRAIIYSHYGDIENAAIEESKGIAFDEDKELYNDLVGSGDFSGADFQTTHFTEKYGKRVNESLAREGARIGILADEIDILQNRNIILGNKRLLTKDTNAKELIQQEMDNNTAKIRALTQRRYPDIPDPNIAKKIIIGEKLDSLDLDLDANQTSDLIDSLLNQYPSLTAEQVVTTIQSRSVTTEDLRAPEEIMGKAFGEVPGDIKRATQRLFRGEDIIPGAIFPFQSRTKQ